MSLYSLRAGYCGGESICHAEPGNEVAMHDSQIQILIVRTHAREEDIVVA
jgi:hypothetical protein